MNSLNTLIQGLWQLLSNIDYNLVDWASPQIMKERK